MKRFLSLFKIQFLSTFRGLGVGLGKMKFVLVLLPLALLPMLNMIFTVINDVSKSVGQQWLVLALGFVFMTLIGFLFAVTNLTALTGKSRNLEQLLTMPVKPGVIGLSIIGINYIFSMLFGLYIMFIPGYMYCADNGWMNIIPISVVTVLAPLLPLAVSLLAVSPFIKMLKNERARAVFMGFFQVAGFGLVLLFYKLVGLTDPGSAQVAGNITDILLKPFEMFPPIVWAAKFMGGLEGWAINGLYYLGVSLAALALIYLVSNYFFKGLFDNLSSGGGSSPNTDSKQIATALSTGSTRSLMKSKGFKNRLYKRQLRILFSQTAFWFQAILSSFVPIFMVVIYQFMGIIKDEQIAELESLIQTVSPEMIGLLLISAGIVTGTFSPMGVSNISREGATFWENKVWPISSRQHVIERLKFTLSFNLTAGFMMVAASFFYITVKPLILAAVIPAVTGYHVFLASFDHLVELKSPNLKWTNPLQVVKNSGNVIISTFSKMGFIGLSVFLIIKFGIGGGVSIPVIFYSVAAVGTVLGITGYLLVRGLGAKLFDRIDA